MDEEPDSFKKGSFLAVRAPEGSFYLCRVNTNITFECGKRFPVTWLDDTGKELEYILSSNDEIYAESIICEINLQKLTRFKYRLSKNGKQFIENELQHLLDEAEEMDLPDEEDKQPANEEAPTTLKRDKQPQPANEEPPSVQKRDKQPAKEEAPTTLERDEQPVNEEAPTTLKRDKQPQSANEEPPSVQKRDKQPAKEEAPTTLERDEQPVNEEAPTTLKRDKQPQPANEEPPSVQKRDKQPANEEAPTTLERDEQPVNEEAPTTEQIDQQSDSEQLLTTQETDKHPENEQASQTQEKDQTSDCEQALLAQELDVQLRNEQVSVIQETDSEIDDVDESLNKSTEINIQPPLQARTSDFNSDEDSYLSSETIEMYADSGSEYRPSDDEKRERKKFNLENLLREDSGKKERKNLNLKNLLQEDYPEWDRIQKSQAKKNQTATITKDIDIPSTSTENSIKHLIKTERKKLKISNKVYFKSSRKTVENTRIYDKRHACFFCHKFFIKITRHLELKHGQELEVARLLAKPKRSKERREGFLLITRAGDFYNNTEVLTTGEGELILSRRPSEREKKKFNISSYGPCPYCLGFLLKKHLWRHAKKCSGRSEKYDENEKRKRIQSQSSALLGSIMCDTDKVFRENIVDTLSNDDISAACRNDILILKFGCILYEKHGNSQKDLIRQSMRQLGRLKIELLNKNKEMRNLKDFISPEHFDKIVEAVRCLSKVNYQTVRQKTEYGIPSLAMKLGYSLRKCVGVLRGMALRKGDIRYEIRLKGFLDILDLEWALRISSNAIATLHKRKMNTAKLVPLTSDLLKLNEFISKEMEENLRVLNSNSNEGSKEAWHRLAQATLSRIILFNKRRGGETGKMLISQYNSDTDWNEENTKELLASLTGFEKKLALELKLIQVDGKRGRTVPVLLTKSMCLAINVLNERRNDVAVAMENPYVFARPYQRSIECLRGPDCLRAMANKAQLEKPQAVTGTRLRKYIATVCQVFNLKEFEVEWLANHLGHDIRVHRDFYRLHESAVELTKVSRILMAVDEGKVAQFYGNNLENINLNDLSDIADSSDQDSEIDIDEEVLEVQLPAKQQNKKRMVNDEEEDRIVPSSKRRQFAKKVAWSSEESEAVLKFFRQQIKAGTVPGKKLCDECMMQFPVLKQKRKWMDIKYYVKNHLDKLRKMKMK